MEALITLPDICEIRVVLEPDGQAEVDEVLETFRSRGTPVTLVDNDLNIVESVIAAT